MLSTAMPNARRWCMHIHVVCTSKRTSFRRSTTASNTSRRQPSETSRPTCSPIRIRTSPAVISAVSFETPLGAGRQPNLVRSQQRRGDMAAERFTNATGSPVGDNTNILTAGPRGPALLQDIWLIEKMAHFDREVIPERRMHAKGWGAYGMFTVTHDITRYTRAKIFSAIGKQTPMFARFSTVAGERGAADAERDIRGTALKFYTEEGNWDLVGNNTPVFFFRDPLRFPDLNHAIKRDPRTGMRSADNNWDFWTLLPEALHQVTVVMSDRGIPRSFRHMHG